MRVNLPTQRGEAGAPLLDFKGEVVGILISSVENGSACYALPIDAAEKIRSDFVRFGEVRHGLGAEQFRVDRRDAVGAVADDSLRAPTVAPR